MGPNPFFEIVPNRTDVDIDAFEGSEYPLDIR